MKAYLKSKPESIGEIAYVYVTDYGQKRLTVEFEYGTVVDAGADEFEVIEGDVYDNAR